MKGIFLLNFIFYLVIPVKNTSISFKSAKNISFKTQRSIFSKVQRIFFFKITKNIHFHFKVQYKIIFLQKNKDHFPLKMKKYFPLITQKASFKSSKTSPLKNTKIMHFPSKTQSAFSLKYMRFFIRISSIRMEYQCEKWQNHKNTLRIPPGVSFTDFDKNIAIFYLVTKMTGLIGLFQKKLYRGIDELFWLTPLEILNNK